MKKMRNRGDKTPYGRIHQHVYGVVASAVLGAVGSMVIIANVPMSTLAQDTQTQTEIQTQAQTETQIESITYLATSATTTTYATPEGNTITFSYDASSDTFTISGSNTSVVNDVTDIGTDHMGALSSTFKTASNVVLKNLKLSGSMSAYFMRTDSDSSTSDTSLKSVTFSNVNTGKVTDMSLLFSGCSSLTTLDLSGLDTSNVTNMKAMFQGCSALTSLNVSGINTSKVTDMSYMFWGCNSLTSLDLRSFSTSNVTNMCAMFWECSGLTNLQVSSFNTANVVNMRGMFLDCNSLTSLDLSQFDLSSLQEAEYMLEASDLSKIKTPVNVSIDIDLPASYRDSTNTVYETLPENTTSSITLRKVVSSDDKVTTYNGIDYSAVYDPDYYAENNPDVAAAFGDDQNALIWHFVNYGMSEGRVANDSFNVVEYMYSLFNEDLRSAFGGDIQQYYYHYMNYGQYEDRSTSDLAAVFDADYYLAANPDVKAYLVNQYSENGNLTGWAMWHYYEYGVNEGRRGNASFGVLNYEAANPDVYAAYGSNLRAATIHYLQYGAGRLTAPVNGFDIYSIPTTRPDVVRVFGNNKASWVGWYIQYGSKGM